MTDDASTYFDWNATTPPAPEVVEAMARAVAEGWGNPASVHRAGRRARAFVEEAREAVASLVGRDPRDVVLTSGGTEANNLAIAFGATRGGAAALIVSAIEHPSIAAAAEAWEARGTPVARVEVTPAGRVEPPALAACLRRAQGPIGLVSVQAVNHETGVVQPVEEIAQVVHAHGALLHVDAVQAVGRLDPSAWRGADLITVAAHKMRGPKGIGALVTGPRLKLQPVLRGGSQERGIRPGTQDAVACAGFAAAAARAAHTPAVYARLAPLRDRLEEGLIEIGRRHGGEPVVNGTAPRAPHVANLSWPGWLGPELAAALDLEGFCVSSGSACSAGTADPSPVITAMHGVERARGAVRVSIGETTDAEAVANLLSVWETIAKRAGDRSTRQSSSIA